MMTVALSYEFVSLASDEDDGAGNRIQLEYDIVFNNVKVTFFDINLVTDHSSLTRIIFGLIQP